MSALTLPLESGPHTCRRRVQRWARLWNSFAAWTPMLWTCWVWTVSKANILAAPTARPNCAAELRGRTARPNCAAELRGRTARRQRPGQPCS
jgi:hypothetical protein